MVPEVDPAVSDDTVPPRTGIAVTLCEKRHIAGEGVILARGAWSRLFRGALGTWLGDFACEAGLLQSTPQPDPREEPSI